MAKHEFGIFEIAPQKGVRYDEYEPHKYGCISVSDEPLDSVAHKLQKIDFYMHTTDIKAKGLAWCGVTLIPPESLDAFADAVGEKSELAELENLIRVAQKEDKWMIHFGL